MHDLLSYWWVFFLFGGGEWVADKFDVGLAANAKRRRRKVAHREKMRELEVEAKRRAMEAANPKPVEPICGCEHHLSFHNRKEGICRKNVGTAKHPMQCECQGYSGPEPLSQIYADPLADL